MRIKGVCIFIFLVLISLSTKAQLFSDSLEAFYPKVIATLRAKGTEPAKKVAFDFNNAWNGKFTTKQQEDIHEIALKMQKKYPYHPYFWYYFSYLAFSTEQAHLNTDQVTQVLAINKEMVESMDGKEYKNFLLGLNRFMARRILGKSKFLLTLTDGGTYTFKVFDEVIEETPTEEDLPLPGYLSDQSDTQEVTMDQPQETADDWGDDSGWDDSGWDDSGGWDDASDGGGWDDTSWDDISVDEDDPWAAQNEDKPARRQKVEAMGQDYVLAKHALYVHPQVTGPGIELENNSLLISTPDDSFNIKETDGVFLLKSREYAGKSAVINWPEENVAARGAIVNLDQFKLRADRADFWTPNAKLTFSRLFEGTVPGVFEFKSIRRPPNELSSFPRFTSNEANINVKLPGGKATYIGGIQISGNDFAGTSVSRKPGTLKIIDGKGNRVIFKGEKFLFNSDSTITSEAASVTIYHRADSIYHPQVEMRYDSKTEELTFMKTKAFQVSAFKSTFFDMDINAEIVSWDMKTDSVNFSILNGKDLVPVTLESKDFFTEVRFGKLGAGLRFHPVMTSVYYANKYGITEFVDLELANEFEVTESDVKRAMRVLEKYGFADYDNETGLVRLRDKAFRYYKASGKEIDYDNILIPSIEPKEPNVTWRLDSGYLKVRGVDRFYLTSDFQSYVEPFDGTVHVEEGRNIRFDGMLHADDFEYKGKDFAFNYDGYFVRMDNIDSIQIKIDIPDSLATSGPEGISKKALSNHLNRTSGTLYLNKPDNKSGKEPAPEYPHLSSDSEATVYFDGPEILNGAYDKSVRFIVPPFEADSSANQNEISYEGVFNSGGIFPTFEETLHLMPDQSLGFVHEIPPEGYNLYGTRAKTYETIRLDNNGIRGQGKIDFITSTIYSDDFVYFPDSVIAAGRKGEVMPGDANGASFPHVIIGPYRMHWEPRIDSMRLHNLRQPFDFYEHTATLDGAINITARGLYGQGELKTLGSRLNSNDISFRETSYSARHAEFEVVTDNPQKPALAGDDIRINFDLEERVANISPEKQGVAAIEFPYAQMKTSMTNAVWDLDESTVTMTKPDYVDINDTYFYTTREELDSLAFNAEQAIYDMRTKKVNIKGIPYIIVADAKIIPENNETTILENFELQAFENAEVIIDTLNGYHHLTKGQIKIYSRNEFRGSAIYQLTMAGKTFDIVFNEFNLKNVRIDEETKRVMTVSGGSVIPEDSLIIAPGFYYKGDVQMFAYKEALELDGYVQLIRRDPSYNYWIEFERRDENTQINIDMENARFEDKSPVISGLHYNLRGELYPTMAELRNGPSDEDFFLPKGILSYDTTSQSFKVEKPSKTTGESYDGYTMIYNDSTKNVVFEGPVSFFSPDAKDVQIRSTVLGVGNYEKSEYSMDAFMEINFEKGESYMQEMADDLLDIIQRFGSPVANDLSIQMMYKLANMTSDEVTREYETSSLKDYQPLYTISDNLIKPLVISGVKMKWSSDEKAWYNTTKLGISNIYKNDLNAKLDGFLEIKKDPAGNDILNLFIQAAPGTWYFISYIDKNLMMYSSNSAFNAELEKKSNYGKAKPNDLVLVLGDENETLSFINRFRESYFGITTPYDLVSPRDINLEDEEFDTIEEKDDEFGF